MRNPRCEYPKVGESSGANELLGPLPHTRLEVSLCLRKFIGHGVERSRKDADLVSAGDRNSMVALSTSKAHSAIAQELQGANHAALDLYEGDALPDGVRSIAYRFRFRSPERTLTDEEVERVFRSILARLEEESGVQVRQ